jgi:hypothetical protein
MAELNSGESRRRSTIDQEAQLNPLGMLRTIGRRPSNGVRINATRRVTGPPYNFKQAIPNIPLTFMSFGQTIKGDSELRQAPAHLTASVRS